MELDAIRRTKAKQPQKRNQAMPSQTKTTKPSQCQIEIPSSPAKPTQVDATTPPSTPDCLHLLCPLSLHLLRHQLSAKPRFEPKRRFEPKWFDDMEDADDDGGDDGDAGAAADDDDDDDADDEDDDDDDDGIRMLSEAGGGPTEPEKTTPCQPGRGAKAKEGQDRGPERVPGPAASAKDGKG